MVDMFVDGWLYIGDVVEVLFDGFFFIVDCKKDIMINVVGKNLMLLLIENMMKVSFYIKECIVIVDKWFYVLVLIQIDFDIVCFWVESKGIFYMIFCLLVENFDIVVLVDCEVVVCNKNFVWVEQIKKVWFLFKEFDYDDGEVMVIMKVCCFKIIEVYGDVIEGFYVV